MSDEICFVLADDKIAVIENSLACLQDVERALRSSRGTISLLLCELSDLDQRTADLMEDLRSFALVFERELSPVPPTTPTPPEAPWRAGQAGSK
ncbi:hypothetical protein NLG97_g1507 [Lecanicillium saksenae]|uniref:Uncharacterized protein n=1 Tax=Lecanicillium saksenae TaxID=468837 RepID=A0ACC1R4U6_9HYPO|nr:hypothetical protein NLG97_g1507 [Lecanicillium saksenae]